MPEPTRLARRRPTSPAGCAGPGRSSARRGRSPPGGRRGSRRGRGAAACRPSTSPTRRPPRPSRSKRSSSSAARARAPPRRTGRRSRPIIRRFSAPVCSSSTRRVLAGQADRAADPAAARRRRRTRRRARCPRRGGSASTRIRTVVVLPAPFGPSSANTRAALDAQVDAVEDAHVAVGLLQADRLDRRFVGHRPPRRRSIAYCVRISAYGIHSRRWRSRTRGRAETDSGLPASIEAAWGLRERPAQGPEAGAEPRADRRRGGRRSPPPRASRAVSMSRVAERARRRPRCRSTATSRPRTSCSR